MGVQTVIVPAGGGGVFDVKIDDEGLYPFVSHAFAHVDLGQVGLLKVGNPRARCRTEVGDKDAGHVLGRRRADAGGARASRRLLARCELSLGRADLPARQSAAARAVAARAREAATARPFRDRAWPEPRLRPSEPRDSGARPRRDLRHGPGSRRTGKRRERLPGRDVQRAVPERRRGGGRVARALPTVLLPRWVSRATLRRRRRARSTRAASSATRSCTPSGQPSTIRIWSSPASSATARRRPDRSRRAGTRTSSSIRAATARFCRSCT